MGKGVLERCCGRRSRAHVGVRVAGNLLGSFSGPLGRRAKGVVFLVVVVLGGALGVGGALAQSLTVDKQSMGSGNTVTVSGTGFPPGALVTVWFDSAGHGGSGCAGGVFGREGPCRWKPGRLLRAGRA
jgi:hypothetical protein